MRRALPVLFLGAFAAVATAVWVGVSEAGGSSYTASSGTTTLGFYDALGSGATTLAVSDFVDASVASGSGGLGAATSSCLAAVESDRMLRMRSYQQSDCSTAAAGDRAQGRLATVSGSWTYAFRLRMSRTDAGTHKLASETSSVVTGGIVYVDGTTKDDDWYSLQTYWSAADDYGAQWYRLWRPVGAVDGWNTYTDFAALQVLSQRVWDVYVSCSGTALTWYLGASENDMRQVGSDTVTSCDGRLGLRTQVLVGSADSVNVYLLGWRSVATNPL